ncbi:MAG: hypothetical protein C0403_18050 [Desulfobacterium sp.]|nr:hypothetical protein [Desulfobacterium sp.]
MENKSLGRGFREISNIFISEDRKEKNSPGKSKEHTSKSSSTLSDESAEDSQSPLTFVNHAPGFFGKDKIDEDSAAGNEHHEATLANIIKNYGECSDLAENMREVEENVTVEKNISYQNMPDAQQNIMKAFCKFLEEGFSIKTIELIKTDTKCRPGKKQKKTEKISIFLEDPPDLAEM